MEETLQHRRRGRWRTYPNAADRERNARQRETSEERRIRLAENARLQRERRNRENDAQRAARLLTRRSRYQQTQQQGDLERAALRSRNTQAQRRSRENEDPERRSQRLRSNAERRRLRNLASETLGVALRSRATESVDEAIQHEGSSDELYPMEYLNTLEPTGMPPHELRLKKGAIVMLLRNLDVTNGLCNGTRLKVEIMGRYVLFCRFICGSRKNQMAVIPRIDNYWDKDLPFRLRRRQFPLRLAFAMTINKAQGQSFNRVGVFLPEDVFSHGQLYVSLSRVRTPDGLKIQSPRTLVKNIVYTEVLL
ncbi:hypothetical protein OESDEN_20006 [Oesophagostomum dentatum]|uniref:DNA helicase Pif1-like 2B domain-containing protein n=1 Tax=Oesophagostomum dentatum TaxID=61180 RepID=A0A0B1SAR9_OESDE|nr:hypothetical protein OESDEN_20006 [Oesophagostomum dentatum]